MWIRKRSPLPPPPPPTAPPPDLQSSTTLHPRWVHLQLPAVTAVSHTKTRCASNQGPRIGIGEEGEAVKGKEANAMNRRIGHDPCAETSDTSSISSSFSHQGHWYEEDKVFPLKKRRVLNLKINDTMTMEGEKKKMNDRQRSSKRSTNKKWVDAEDDDYVNERYISKKKGIIGEKKTEFLRCRRTNGKEWRCYEASLMGCTLCEYHLDQRRRLREKGVGSTNDSMKMEGEKKKMNVRQRSSKGTNKKCVDAEDDDYVAERYISKKKGIIGEKKTEFSRCRRTNGKEWRCYEASLVGCTLCEYHLDQRRLLRVKGIGSTNKRMKFEYNDNEDEEVLMVGKKRKRVGVVVKARSMRSLLSQTVPLPPSFTLQVSANNGDAHSTSKTL